jgi:tetratricopeptide (TPR) repeat protein
LEYFLCHAKAIEQRVTSGIQKVILELLKLPFALLFFASCAVLAQVPRAVAVDPALRPDVSNDFFQRGKNLYDSAQASTVFENRQDYFQRAAQIFSEYLTSFSNHPNAEMAWWYLGNSYYQSGQVDEGKRCFSTLLNRYGNGKWAAAAAYTLAVDHYNKAEYAFAAPLFERYAVNASKPEERPRGNYMAGSCYRLLGRDREAIGAFRKVISDPAGGLFAAQSKISLGHLSLKTGELQNALKQFEEVAAEPNSTLKYRGEAALHAALTATKLGKTDLSDQYLRLILGTAGMENFRPDAQTALMANHFSKKEYRAVIELFRRSSIKATGDKEAARLMIAGRSYMRIQQPSDALQLFREVERITNPQSETAFNAAYYRLLCFFQIEGRHVPDQVDAFLQLYRKSRPEDPRIHTALLMKAETLFSKKEIAAAANVYNEINVAVISAKNRPGLLYQRGWCLSEAGDSLGAVRSLSDFISKYPEDPRVPSAIAKRAKAYAESAEPAKAIADYDRLTKDGVSEELASFAWLESARLRRGENNLPDMILRYRGLLEKPETLNDSLKAEANYWIGFGLVKTHAAKDGIPHLERARTLRPQDYRKHAGLLLCLVYFASQEADSLATEIHLAIDGKYDSDIPDKTVHWSGIQAYNSGDYHSSAKFLALISNPQEPRETPKEVWRYLAKARLEIGEADGALVAVNHLLEVEEDPGWQADGLVDRGRALFELKRVDEARKAAEEALALRPQGHTSARLNLLLGDLELKAGDAKAAAGKYLIVIEFHDDKKLEPLALWKMSLALEQQGDAPEAEKYRQQLSSEFPSWKEPAR